MFDYEVKYGKMIMVKCMSSRMDKYYKNDGKDSEKRTKRHKDIYANVSDENYDNLNLTSNVSIIKTDADLDLGTIKEIVNKKYEKSKPQRQDLSFEDDFEDDIDKEETKEYDLKKIIETAHKNKEPNYNRERFEHLRETQYDILNSLNIVKEGEEKVEKMSEEEATLINLIKTVNDNAEKNHKISSVEDDLMGSLMSSDETEVLEPVLLDDDEPEKKPTILEELERTKQLSRHEIESELAKDDTQNKVEEEKETPMSPTEELSNSFYTGKFQIDERDMDDFEDLEREMKGGSLVVKILIVVIVLITIAIAIYLMNRFFNWGLF